MKIITEIIQILLESVRILLVYTAANNNNMQNTIMTKISTNKIKIMRSREENLKEQKTPKERKKRNKKENVKYERNKTKYLT